MESMPTFFYARTTLNTDLIIDWEKMLSANKSSAITFSSIPDYYAAVLIPKVTGLAPYIFNISIHSK